MKLLVKALEDKQYVLDLEAREIETIISETINRMVALGAVPADAASAIIEALVAREKVVSTAIGNAVAIPHAYLEACPEPLIVVVRLARPVNLDAPDGRPTRFLFFLLGPPGSAEVHLDLLAKIARLAADDEFRYEAGEARNGEDLLQALKHSVERATPKVKPKSEPDPALAFTGRPFGGVIADVKRRLPHYVSDFTDGFNTKTLGSTLFLFFACLAPAITFGGVMADKTGGTIGAVEMLLASAFCGIVYSLVAGQPLIILGGTGPLLVFTAVLYRLCESMDIPFLATYAWVGIWSALMLVILAVTDSSALMRYFTRFTDETFAALISIIFIYEALHSMIHAFDGAETAGDYAPAFLTLLVALGTFYIAMSLSAFRKSRYLLPKLREFLADFGPTIALGLMTFVSIWFSKVELQSLTVPDKIGTTTGRPWLIDMFDLPVWVIVASLGPAALVTVLMYLDQNITARLVNSRDQKLQKGAAYHLDLAVVGVLMGICSIFGMPWLVAATVRSLNHVRSLATTEQVTTGNESRDRILHVHETRVTGLAIHVLIALSLLVLPLLKLIPLAVLYGIFLFMGVVSMAGNQFFERLRLWAMESASHPSTHYMRRVPVWTIHKFTLIQLVCLVILWVVKTSAAAIVFPLFIALTVPVRLVLNKFFAEEHLEALDAEEEPEDEATHWT